jgi:amino acid transporter
VLLLDTLAAGASSGPSVLFWWLLLTIIFLLPYGMICAELGVVYPEQGGIYAWVKRAFGQRMASRISWYYWANVAVWIPAIFILFAGVFKQLFLPDLSLAMQIALGIGLIWVVVAANVITMQLGKWVPNLGAIIKMLIFLALILGAFSYAANHGVANDFSLDNLIPSTDNGGLSLQYLPAVIYGMLGFELVSASSGEMKNPRKDLPRALFYAIALVVLAYMLATTAILVAIPADDVDLVEGLVDTLRMLFGGGTTGDLFVTLLGIGALYTFFSNGVTWGMGANRAAAQAAIDRELPAWFGIESKQGTPAGAAIILGISASIMLLLYGSLAGNNEDLFWSLFAFSGVIFMLPYVAMCLAYLRLREINPIADQDLFRVPGSSGWVKIMGYSCALILSVTIVLFCYVPGEGVSWEVLIGSLVLILIGEFAIRLGKATETF